jgi:hypothetical protein
MTEGSTVPYYSTFGELMYKPFPEFIDTNSRTDSCMDKLTSYNYELSYIHN